MGFFEKIKAGLTRTKENIGHSFDQLFAGELNDDFYDELEETLILGDMGEMCIRDRYRYRCKTLRLRRRLSYDCLWLSLPRQALHTSPRA